MENSGHPKIYKYALSLWTQSNKKTKYSSFLLRQLWSRRSYPGNMGTRRISLRSRSSFAWEARGVQRLFRKKQGHGLPRATWPRGPLRTEWRMWCGAAPQHRACHCSLYCTLRFYRACYPFPQSMCIVLCEPLLCHHQMNPSFAVY